MLTEAVHPQRMVADSSTSTLTTISISDSDSDIELARTGCNGGMCPLKLIEITPLIEGCPVRLNPQSALPPS